MTGDAQGYEGDVKVAIILSVEWSNVEEHGIDNMEMESLWDVSK